MKDIQEILTNLEQSALGIPQVSVDGMGLEAPVRRREPVTNPLLIPSLLVDAKLSPETFQMEQERLDRMERKKRSLRSRKKYTRKRGTVHPKKKEASRRRRLERQWKTNPLAVLLWGYGKKDIDKGLWDTHIAPLWEKYDPRDLEIKKYRGWGTKQRPLTVFGMDVIHRTEGTVYDGNALELFLLSNKKAP